MCPSRAVIVWTIAMVAVGCGFRRVSPACYVYIVASDSHACARKTDGTLWCWGDNQFGQLGTGDQVSPRLTPTLVTSLGNTVARVFLPTGIATISARTAYSCARSADNALWCWGNNESGQLGTGDTSARLTPVQIDPQGLGNSVHIASGGAGFMCAQRTDNTLYCWGDNQYGQLGIGTTMPSLSPVQVDPTGLGANVAMVYAGGTHVCAIKTTDATLWCWGNNQSGQLGIGSNSPRNTPTQVSAAGLSSGVTTVFAGAEHTCATVTDGSLWCWGGNQFGQLGVGDTRSRNTPTRVDFADIATGVSVVTAGGNHTCAAKTDGTLWCWGGNEYGQLGTGDQSGRARPAQVDASAFGAAVIQTYAGGNHSCARTADSALYCWGSNQYGQLGAPAGANGNLPVKVAPACP
jgi:alpha-tubulin suppressor-like RCC1 family protein